ncbi:unnamed protein product [Echinostoma caproni]|uniref:C2 NT-type domain-containing protein n=1 Tax=Echinostoma caproni TaxID=27848 RepID=A0A183B733_9TREM|nr:unnamed protein product [Echinostoma caproni]
MSVWRRLQRVGKKAAKFQFTTSLQELTIECNRQYRPGTFVIVWSRRSRRYTSKVGNVTTSRLSGPSVRRRVLATRQIDLSEFAANIPTQTSLKVVMRLASKKLASASLLLTLHSVIMKEGEAT